MAALADGILLPYRSHPATHARACKLPTADHRSTGIVHPVSERESASGGMLALTRWSRVAVCSSRVPFSSYCGSESAIAIRRV